MILTLTFIAMSEGRKLKIIFTFGGKASRGLLLGGPVLEAKEKTDSLT